MGRLDRIRRIVYLREYLETDSRVDADQVAQTLGVSRRTLYRDLRLLRTVNLQVAALLPPNAMLGAVRPSDFTWQQAAVVLAVLLHDVHFEAQSPHCELWDKARRQIVDFVRHKTRRFHREIDKQITIILGEQEAGRSNQREHAEEAASSSGKGQLLERMTEKSTPTLSGRDSRKLERGSLCGGGTQ